MSAGAAVDSKADTQTTGGDAGKATATGTPAPPSVEQLLKDLAAEKAAHAETGKKLGEASKEAADRRNAAKKADDEKRQAELDKAAKDGEWGKVVTAKDEQLAKLTKDLEALSAHKTRAETLEAKAKARAEALVAKLPESDKALVTRLPIEDQADFAERLLALSNGAGAARSTGNATPPPPKTPIDLNAMNADDRRKAIADMTPEQRLALAQQKSGSTKSWLHG